MHDWVKLLDQFKARYKRAVAHIESPSSPTDMLVEIRLMQSLSNNISKANVHVSAANVEAAALCLRMVWHVRASLCLVRFLLNHLRATSASIMN